MTLYSGLENAQSKHFCQQRSGSTLALAAAFPAGAADAIRNTSTGQ